MQIKEFVFALFNVVRALIRPTVENMLIWYMYCSREILI